MEIIALLGNPATWAALFTLITLEIVLGIDNLVFIAILSNKLPPEQQQKARRIGLALALILRIALLLLIGWLVTLQAPLIDLGVTGAPGPHGEPTFETAFSGRDLILIAGGLFLLWKATKEIHHAMDGDNEGGPGASGNGAKTVLSFGAAIAQIIALDIVISIDSMSLPRVDFIKIDVEGMEEEVLAGATNTIARSKPIMLIETIKSNAANLQSFVDGHGYIRYALGINMLAVHSSDPFTKHLKIENDALHIL